MHYKSALIALAFTAALPAAMAEQLKMTVTAEGTLFNDLDSEEFGWQGANSPFLAEWSVIYDTDDISASGTSVSVLSAEISITIGNTYYSNTPAQYFEHISMYHSPSNQGQSTIVSPLFRNYATYRFLQLDLVFGAQALPLALPTEPVSVTYTGPRVGYSTLTMWDSLGSQDNGVMLNPTSLRLTVSPVPEPGTYAMLLAGLVALGATAIRRRAG